MLRNRVLRADARVHEPREGGQHVDRWEHSAPVELSTEDHLALGDVAGEIGDGVGDVVVRHGQDGQLRHAAGLPLDDAGALEE